MEKIKKVRRVETGRYAQGSNFSKGDHIATPYSYIANGFIELSAELIRQYLGVSRIPYKSLEKLKGLDVDQFKKK